MPIDLKFTEKYNSKQQKAIDELLTNKQKTRILLRGGSRSGKTRLVRDFVITRAILYPGSKHIVLRKTESDVRSTTWLETYLPVLKELEKQGACKIYKYPAMVEFINGSIIKTGGLAPSEVDKVLGIEYATIHIDEASEIAYKSVLPLYTRLNDTTRHMKTGLPVVPKIVFTENPPTTNHWSYYIFMLKKEPDGQELRNPDRYGQILINPVDNSDNLSENYLDDLKSLPERSRKRFLDGEFGQMSGLVYDNFDPEKHIIDDEEILEGKRYDLKKAKLYRVIDFGFVHPFVCLWIAHFPDDNIVIYREFYAKGKTVRENSIDIKRLSGDEKYEYTLSDHDSEDRATLAENGIETKPADKEVIAGIDKTYDLYNVNKIKVLRSLNNFINEKYSYQWKENSSKDREVVKLNDDGQDCERYFVNDLHRPKFYFPIIRPPQ